MRFAARTTAREVGVTPNHIQDDHQEETVNTYQIFNGEYPFEELLREIEADSAASALCWAIQQFGGHPVVKLKE